MRVFFSYSHDDNDHKKWVKNRATELESKGLSPILDQMHLKPGKDILHFAESAVESSQYVLMICTPNYGIKANNRVRGVGWESMVITSELFHGNDGKFIAILKEGDPDISIPKYMKTKLWIDLRGDNWKNEWNDLCKHMLNNGDPLEIGTLVYYALFEYDESKIYDQPRLPELKRFTQFVETGKDEENRWFVIRKDPIKNDLATILFKTQK